MPEVVSQLAYRVLGPYKNRARSVIDWAGLQDHPPRLQREVADDYQVTQRAIGQRIQRVAAAGRRLPLTADIIEDLLRPDAADDPEVRRRCAILLGMRSPEGKRSAAVQD